MAGFKLDRPGDIHLDRMMGFDRIRDSRVPTVDADLHREKGNAWSLQIACLPFTMQN